MEQSEKIAIFRRNFQVPIPFADGTLESACVFTQAAVEVMLSGRDTEDIQADFQRSCMSFFCTENMAVCGKKGKRRSEKIR